LFVLPDFVLATRSDFKVNEKRILSLYENFADEESCRVMRAVIGYRLTADPTYMRSFQVRFSDQYFEPFFDLYDPIFIDAGGYDGETTAEFCRRFPKYRKVYIFEPSEKNINLAQVKLSNLHNIEYIDKGLSDVADSVWFNADAGSASAIATSGSEKIDVIPLDLYPTEKLSFIKMDLEGWELPALHGARNHILKDFPVLAISAYHKASDFWQIFEYVYSLHSDYKVYLRHYTEGWSESVIFFVPGKN
jgi:FkbM family methyltransferase